MKNKLSVSLAAFICMAVMNNPLFAQAVAPGSNVPAGPPAWQPDVNTFPTLSNLTGTTNFNYIRTEIPDQPTTSLPAIPAPYHRQITDYYDGLGRLLQTVNQRGHADGYDIVQTHGYDSLGRESYQYLPYATNIDDIYTNGNFHPNITGDIHNFFYIDAGDPPYAKTEYDNSPLNRVVKQLAPGYSWVGSGRGVVIQYGTNEPVIYTTGNPPVGQQMTGAYPRWTKDNNIGSVPVATDVYADNTLYKTTTIDEDGNETDIFKDKLGRVVWKRTLLNNVQPIYRVPSDYANTFYIYNDLNQLICVIPPAAVTVHAVVVSGVYTVTWGIASGALNMCYQYQYDTRGRLMAKQEPDKAVEYYVYDKRDRPVFYQDGNLRAQGKWQFTIYDALDRSIVTGNMASGQTQSSLQNNYVNSATTYPSTSVLYYIKNYNLWHTYPTPESLPNSTIYSYTYYDNYDNSQSGMEFDNTQFPAIGTGQPFLVAPVKSNNTRGLVTGTKVRVLGPGMDAWKLTSSYYDDKGRLIQQKSTNIDGGIDIASNVYYFQGMLWKTITRHQNPNAKAIPGASEPLTEITLDDTYDRNIGTGGGNDLVWAHHQKINDGLNYELAYYDYNESGQVRNKQFTVTNVTNTYNIRGWLTGISADYYAGQNPSVTTSYFNEALSYDNGFASKLYNGNIAGITWSGYHTNALNSYPSNAYGYSYDMLNRLTHAEYRYQPTSGDAWSKAVKDYTVSNIGYDLNGNLLSMDQRNPGSGSSPIDMDKLTYTYAPSSNKLAKVHDDVAPASTVGLPDFKDNADLSTEYTYDDNGSITSDANKHITAVTYNYLNKPEQETVNGQGAINYYYDAAGNRLRKIVTPLSGDADTFDYIGNFVYKNNVLQYVMNEEGRSRPVFSSDLNTTKFVYDYFIKDHLGNVRTTVTANPISALYLASCEISMANIEQLFFDNIPATRALKPGSTDTGDTEAAHLVAADSAKRIGPAIMLRVMPGDQVTVSADGYYYQAPSDPHTVSTADVMSSLMTTLTGGISYTGVPVESLPQNVRTIQDILGNGGLPGAIDSLTVINEDSTAPKAYLNVLVFDDNFQLIPAQSGRFQVQTGADIWQSVIPADATWTPIGGSVSDHTFTPYINQPGYEIIYVNDQSIGDDVWFDNLDISHYSGGVLEDNFYYPYGLTISNDAQPVNTDQPYKLTTKELESHFDLNTYDFGARQMDMTIGRWNSIDLLAAKYDNISPFAYCGNNPIINLDPDGMKWLNRADAEYAATLQDELGQRLKDERTNLQNATDRVTNLQKTIEKKGLTNGRINRLTAAKAEVENIKTTISDLTSSSNEITDMGNDPDQTFTYTKSPDGADVGYTNKRSDDVIEMKYVKDENAIHESAHGYALWKGTQSANILDREIVPYQRQYSFNPNSINPTSTPSDWGSIKSRNDITPEWIMFLHVNGHYPYMNGNKYPKPSVVNDLLKTLKKDQ